MIAEFTVYDDQHIYPPGSIVTFTPNIPTTVADDDAE